VREAEIAVLDFGGQYAHLIAKRLRRLGVYATISASDAGPDELSNRKGIILSGGPSSVYDARRPPFRREILDLPIPILGLCYGIQLIAHELGGRVEPSGGGEFGRADLEVIAESPILAGLGRRETVWMSHGDLVTVLPPEFRAIARTLDCPAAAIEAAGRPIFGLQFHPEVTDTPCGERIFENFVRLCGAERTWSIERFIAEEMDEIRRRVGMRKVLLFLSGGVDSTVAYALLARALGEDRVLGLYIDNGFMRKGETEAVRRAYDAMGWRNVRYIEAEDEFLRATAGLVDPQRKRAAVGEQFIRTRARILDELDLDPQEWLLGQGTLYPDIIESGGTRHADTIKTHHNRIRGIEDLIASGMVVEPLRDLYKDEVRRVGEALGLPAAIVWRHPFPGPGLSINVLCHGGGDAPAIPSTARDGIRAACAAAGYEAEILPVRSVGVQGDQRSYAPPVLLRGPADWDRLEALSTAVTNRFRAVNRVVYLLRPDRIPAFAIREAQITKDRLDLLREADAIAVAAIDGAGLHRSIFQHLTILLPLASEGGCEGIVLRPVWSEDVMTARFARLPWDLVGEIADRIRALPGIGAVCYDVTHKPPATFGWE